MSLCFPQNSSGHRGHLLLTRAIYTGTGRRGVYGLCVELTGVLNPPPLLVPLSCRTVPFRPYVLPDNNKRKTLLMSFVKKLVPGTQTFPSSSLKERGPTNLETRRGTKRPIIPLRTFGGNRSRRKVGEGTPRGSSDNGLETSRSYSSSRGFCHGWEQ